MCNSNFSLQRNLHKILISRPCFQKMSEDGACIYLVKEANWKIKGSTEAAAALQFPYSPRAAKAERSKSGLPKAQK